MKCNQTSFSFSLDSDDQISHILSFKCPSCDNVTEIQIGAHGNEIKVSLKADH